MKKRYLLSLIPILGSIIFTFYLFLVDKKRFSKAFWSHLAGMLSFIVLYGGFSLICNATSLDLVKYEWLAALMLVISGIVWNIVYFTILSKLESK